MASTSTEGHDLDLVREEWSRFADEYDDYYSGASIERENECIARLVRSIAHDKSAIDLGCGTAQILDHVDFRRYTGVDMSEDMIREARHPSHADYVVKDYRDLAPMGYDAVISLFHGCGFVPPQQTYAATERLMHSDGDYLLMYPTPAIEDRGNYPVDVLDAMHFTTPEELHGATPPNLTITEMYRFQPINDVNPLLTPITDPAGEKFHGQYTYIVVVGHHA